MKRIAAVFLSLSVLIPVLAQNGQDPVIMTIGNKKVTKSEFQYIWEKNNTESSLETQSLDEYVELFVNFKLKVAEAESQGLDKRKEFLDELDGYRRQLVVPYLTDEETLEKIAGLTYSRVQEYVEFSQIVIRVDLFATPEDTLAAWKKAMEAYEKVVSKPADFASVAAAYSEDASRSKGGYLGFVTGSRFNYTLENSLYSIKEGTVSKPIRTENGYHIIKVHSRKPAFGRYNASHIMVKSKDTDSPQVQQAAIEKIAKAYDALKTGLSFEEVAVDMSEDANTAGNGGYLGALYCGALPIQIEEAVFSQEMGAVSEPVKSEYGWHIIRTNIKEPYPSLERMREEIDNIINKDERAGEPGNVLVEKLRKAYGSTVDASALNDIVLQFDNLRVKNDSSGVKQLLNSNRRLFTIGEATYAVKDFLVYMSLKPVLANNVNKAFDYFIKDMVIGYEDARLEQKYPEFGHLMQEYRDGILLFEISNREIWEKAETDEAGLKAYFEAHKADYAWSEPRFKGFLVKCASKEVAEQVKQRIRELPADSVGIMIDREFNRGQHVSVLMEYGVFKEGSDELVDQLAFNKPKNVSRSVASNLTEAFVEGKMLNDGPEDVYDVQGLVISDYQNHLEKEWLKTLRNKYKVSINKSVLKSVNND